MEHKMVSIADQVFEELERDILVGTYARDELLTEIKLSEKMGVSRTPIREALRRLDQEHIIEITPKGARVIGITPDDIRDIFEIRLRIEGLAARWAAEKATDEAITEMKEVLDLQEFYTTKAVPDQLKNTDSRFHELLYASSNSNALLDTLAPLHRRIVKYRKASLSGQQRAEQSYDEHRAILQAVINRDGDEAERLLRRHIENARDNILGREI